MINVSKLVSLSQIKELFSKQRLPRVSLYQPTFRHFPENQQDPIRYKNLVNQVESSLANWEYPDIKGIIENFRKLEGDKEFWNYRTGGLAIFATPETFEIFETKNSLPELVRVGDRFHIRPLLVSQQLTDQFQVLCLTREEAKLYEGDSNSLEVVDLKFPATLSEVLGEDLTDPHLTFASYGGVGGNNSPMVHGHGSKDDEVKLDRDRFFKEIAEGVLKHHSNTSKLPLILAALTEYHTPFREAASNLYLLPIGIHQNPHLLTEIELCEQASELMRPIFESKLLDIGDKFSAAVSAKTASDKFTAVANAAVSGRIATLLVDLDSSIPGEIDENNGLLIAESGSEVSRGDILDTLSELVLNMGGEVFVLPASKMPTESPVAAIYRY